MQNPGNFPRRTQIPHLTFVHQPQRKSCNSHLLRPLRWKTCGRWKPSAAALERRLKKTVQARTKMICTESSDGMYTITPMAAGAQPKQGEHGCPKEQRIGFEEVWLPGCSSIALQQQIEEHTLSLRTPSAVVRTPNDHAGLIAHTLYMPVSGCWRKFGGRDILNTPDLARGGFKDLRGSEPLKAAGPHCLHRAEIQPLAPNVLA